jgi:hypothetical protein
MTDVPGVLRDKDDVATKFNSLNIRECRQLTEEGVIAGGMIPKVRSTVPYSRVQYSTVQCSTVQYTAHCDAVQYSAVQCSTLHTAMQCSLVQYSAVHCTLRCSAV